MLTLAQENSDSQRGRTRAIDGETYDLVFTHSQHGEYGQHANHTEVQEIVTELSREWQFGKTCRPPAYFSYETDRPHTAPRARLAAQYYLPLTYPELLWKCQLCHLAPDCETNLRNLAYPCPNPEAFEGDGLELPESFVPRP
jgi:hypothetical protein